MSNIHRKALVPEPQSCREFWCDDGAAEGLGQVAGRAGRRDYAGRVRWGNGAWKPGCS